MNIKHHCSAVAVIALTSASCLSAQTVTAAAIQWAISGVVVDGASSLSLSSGNNRVFNLGTAELGQKYLANLDSLPNAKVMFLTNSRYQDVVTVVAEPASTALLGLGAIGFLLRRKRA